MKKLLCILLSITLLFLCGCAASQPNGTQGNSTPSESESKPDEALLSTPFTDEFFADVVGIGTFSGEQMDPIIAYLKSLELEPSDIYLGNVNENGEVLFGGDSIHFEMSDGTTVIFLHNHMTITNKDGSCSFVLVEGNLNLGLQEAYEQASGIDKG